MSPTYSEDITYSTTPISIGPLMISSGVSFTAGEPIAASIPMDQLIFWTRRWRDGDAESATARAAGDSREFDSGIDAVRWLLRDDD